MVNVLVVEDDEKLNKIVCGSLKSRGYAATGCLSAVAALEKMGEEKFDIVVSDVMMPGKDGFEFAEEVRAADKDIPVIFMTALGDLTSKQRGFRLGADDYITKPFDMDELLLRVGALLRRANIEKSRRIEIGGFVMDEEEHTAYLDGEEVPFTVREFDILYKLLSFPKKTFTRAQLMEMFWDYDSSATSRTVDVYMAKIREKTASAEGFEIVTVHGLGYKAVLK
ncbi:MAG: response regulator transcription factor [Eubacteriales bacterium]